MRIVLAAVLLVTASPALAELNGSSEPLAVQAVHNYAGCVVQRSPRAAAELLDMDFQSAGYADRLKRFAQGHDYCARKSRIGFGGVLFAGAMAEHLLELRFKPAQLPVVVASIPNPPLQARDETEMMALCTVRTAPAEVAALMQQPVATPAEAGAMQALSPQLTKCLAAGQALRVNRPGLRSVLALAAWRVAKSEAR